MPFRKNLQALALLAVPSLIAAQDPILQRLPADTAQLLVIRDPLPHIEAILASPAVRDLLAGTADLQRELAGMTFDAAALSKQLGLFRALIPTEIVLAAPATAATDILHLGRAAICVAVLQALGKNAEHQELIDRAKAACQQSIDALRAPDMTGWVTTRDERTAESWFDSMVEALRGMPAMDGLQIDVADTKVTARIRPFELQRGMLGAMLGRFGVKAPADRPYEITAVLEQTGNRLMLRVGESGQGPAPAERLGSLWQPEALVYLRHDVGEGELLIAEANELVGEAFSAEIENQAAEQLMQVAAALERLSTVGPPTAASLTLGDAATWTVHMDLGEELPVEAPSAATLRALAPADGPFALTQPTLDLVLVGYYQEFLTRVMQRADRPESQEVIDWVAEHLAGALDYLQSEDSSLFEAGTLIATHAAAFRGCKAFELGALPFLGITLVAKATDAASGREFVETLTARVAEGLGVDPKKVWTEVDLGLGVPVMAFAWDLVPGHAQLGLDADLHPHWLVVDGHLVIGTDREGTKAVVARMRGTATTSLPSPQTFAWIACHGDHLVKAAQGVMQWAAAFAGKGRGDGVGAESLRRFGDVMAATLQLVDRFDSHTTVEGTQLRDVTTLRIKKR